MVQCGVEQLDIHDCALYLHVSFVVRADLLDSDVILGVDERLCGCVGLSDGHNTRNVLEVTVIVHFHLQRDISVNTLT